MKIVILSNDEYIELEFEEAKTQFQGCFDDYEEEVEE